MSSRVLSLCVALFAMGCSLDWDRLDPALAPRDAGKGMDVAAPMDGPSVPPDTAPADAGCDPANDPCPDGQYCSPTTRACAQGCRNDRACTGAMGVDGGAAPMRCNTATHACAQCVQDDHCPIGQLCRDGACVTGCGPGRGCPTGEMCCGSACVNTQTSASNCGACGTQCSLPNATPACTGGRCAVGSCVAGFGNCDGNDTNGCETNVTESASHCGACGMRCPAPTGGTAACRAGTCGLGGCNAGFGNCDGNDTNGCETSVTSSLLHCGECGRECTVPGGTPVCAAGICQRSGCAMGLGDCDGNTVNGCEADLTRDLMHCGGCGRACSFAHATAACAMGVCSIARCDTGWGNCDGNATNGCETNLNESAAHCGMCGVACNPANATGACVAGACRVGECRTNFGDCNGMGADGCESNLLTDPAHCGSCPAACPTRPNAMATCGNGTCGAACNTGFGNCDGNPSNGCETDTRTAAAHCGGCGVACALPNANATCSGGACRVTTCLAGYADCDGNAANGCETDTRSDLFNCGACGRTCSVTNTNNSCVAGACRVVNCEGTYGNCDGNDTNGCETEIFTNSQHCGACGFVCNAAGRTCNSGRCATPASNGYVIATAPTSVTWVDACSAPGMTRFMQGQDDSYVGGALPFTVDFWGGLTNQYLLGSNGIVGFGMFYGGLFTASGQVVAPMAGRYGSFGNLPTFSGGTYQAPAPAIYALGVDLFLSATGVCVATVGTAPNRRWVAETFDAQIYMRPNVHLTFEVIANETPNNVFDVLYNTPWQTPDGTPFLATDVTVGTQDFRVVAASLRADQHNVGVTPTTRLRFTPR